MNKSLIVGLLAIAGLGGGCGSSPVEELEQQSFAHSTPPPPPSLCAVSVQPKDLLCTDRPLGNPRAECGSLGLEPAGKDDELSGATFAATQNAYVAIVKSGSGGCNPGQSAYRVYVDVRAGDTLSAPADQGISHVTYCACPTN